MQKSEHVGQHASHECYPCKLHQINIGKASDFPTRTPGKTAPSVPDPAWERGIARDERGVPFIHNDLSPVGVKEFGERRSFIEENQRKARQASST